MSGPTLDQIDHDKTAMIKLSFDAVPITVNKHQKQRLRHAQRKRF